VKHQCGRVVDVGEFLLPYTDNHRLVSNGEGAGDAPVDFSAERGTFHARTVEDWLQAEREPTARRPSCQEVAMRSTIERLRAEFLEMPGLRLNAAQTQRLCGVDRTLCQDVLDALVDVKFLRVNADGTYSRLADGEDVRGRTGQA